MKPYLNKYVLGQIEKYNSLISQARVGNFEIRKEKQANVINGYMYKKEEETNLESVGLYGPNNVWMRISHMEVESSYMIIKHAKGKVGVVGLGLGYVVQELAQKSNVDSIVVYEKEKDVIDLYKLSFKDHPKIKIIHGDAYEATSEKFDFFYVDIYEYKLTQKVVDDYIKFNELHYIKEYLFWGLEHFLLSCRYEEIVWVYIPELWMEISKSMYLGLAEANMLPFYSQVDETLASEVLKKFKVVLD